MKVSNCIPKRHILAAVGHFVCLLAYILRFNFGIALAVMVEKPDNIGGKRTISTSQCPVRSNSSFLNSTIQKPPSEFKWSEKEKGFLSSGFFHGYVPALLLSSLLISKYSHKWIVGIGLFVTSVFTLVTPLAAKRSFSVLYCVRLLLGCAQGLSLPAVHGVLGRWSPTAEKSIISGIVFSGLQNGSGFAMIFGGLICKKLGWPSIFYVFGGAGVVAATFWIFFVYDSPCEHPSISEEEKLYILSSHNTEVSRTSETSNDNVPWLDMLLSLPVWAISAFCFTHDWITYLILTDIPTYFRNVYNVGIENNGLLSGFPFLIATVTEIMGGYLADYIISRGVSTTKTRNVLFAVCTFVTGVLMILFGFIGCNMVWLMATSLFLAITIFNFKTSCIYASILDVSPKYAGILWAGTSFIGNIAGAITPIVTGFLTDGHPTQYYYRIVFIIAAVVGAFGAIFFCIFFSGEEQRWNRSGLEEKDDESPLLEAMYLTEEDST